MPYVTILKVRKFQCPNASRFGTARQNPIRRGGGGGGGHKQGFTNDDKNRISKYGFTVKVVHALS